MIGGRYNGPFFSRGKSGEKYSFETIEKVSSKMLDLYESTNKLGSIPEYTGEKYELLDTALLVECGELLNELPWKWWCASYHDIPKQILELVDIWYFLIGKVSLHYGFNSAYNIACDCSVWEQSTKDIHVIDAIKRMMFYSLKFSPIEEKLTEMLHSFFDLLDAYNLTYEDLLIYSRAKITLNGFRHTHGYREGNYQKIWDGEEDNVHLMRILQGNMDISEKELEAELLKAMEKGAVYE